MKQKKDVVIITCRNNIDMPQYCVLENHKVRMLMDSFITGGYQCSICDYNLVESTPIEENKILVFYVTIHNIKQTITLLGDYPNIVKSGVLWFPNRRIYVDLSERYRLADYKVIVGESYSEIVAYFTNGNMNNVAYFDSTCENLGRSESSIGNTYLKNILLNGGPCELLAGGYCKKCRNCLRRNINTLESLSQDALVTEINLLAKTYNVRTISIITPNFFTNEALYKVFHSKELPPQVKFSICCCYKDIKENISKIDLFKEHLYNIDLFIDIYCDEREQLIALINEKNIRVKIHFTLFTEQSTKKKLIDTLSFLEKGTCSYAPDCLFKKRGELSPSMAKIYTVLQFMYKRIFLPKYIELVDYENSLKQSFRLGERTDYDALEEINEIILARSIKLNCTLFKTIRRVIELEQKSKSIDELFYSTLSEENVIKYLFI